MTDQPGQCTRRTFLAGMSAALAASLAEPARSEPIASALGEWRDGGLGLPCYAYTGPLRFADHHHEANFWGLDGNMLPDDPVFLLGNHRLSLFTHASGVIQILSGEGAWARMYQGEGIWSGKNHASCRVGDQAYDLIGLDAAAAKTAERLFGVGFARYAYRPLDGLRVTRTLHVRPSTTVGEGVSAFLLHVEMENTTTSPLNVDYVETVLANYRMLPFDSVNDPKAPVYQATPAEKMGADAICVRFTVRPRRRMTFPPPGQMTPYEQNPPALFVHAAGDPETQPFASTGASGLSSIGIRSRLDLKPGEKRQIHCVIGYTRDPSETTIGSLAEALRPGAASEDASAFAAEWRKIVPPFVTESDPQLRREMQWNAAVLEAMATWREYQNETIVAQGSMYEYAWGLCASSRDFAQQALPSCHINPALARSTLRFLFKRTVPDGEVKLNDQGSGWAPSGAQQTSDQQLYLFILLAEYLRVTTDTALLSEKIAWYPIERSGEDTVLAHVRQAFVYLRDRVGMGRHGLIRLWNSDWNDMFYWWPTKSAYNSSFDEAESCMNTAMAIVTLGDLAPLLARSSEPESAGLAAAMLEFRAELLDAWWRDLDGRPFPRRAWTDATTSVGEDNMWLEPQGYALLIPEMGDERRRALLSELERRLMAPEKIGARQIEKPVPHPPTPQGARENGGFWFALYGPVVLGAATLGRDRAERYLARMTFKNYAKNFPNYWTGQWTASDSIDSSLLPTEGLAGNLTWCAHAHAWPLYCYLRLREKSA